jgi:AraC-like DNA-binding protein
VTNTESSGPTSNRHSQRQRLERAAAIYLPDCYARETAARISELAQRLGVTREHLTRVVSEAYGITPLEFLRGRQLDRALHLLRTTSYSTVRVAAMSGFGTHASFYRTFKKAMGMTPGRYRKQVTK